MIPTTHLCRRALLQGTLFVSLCPLHLLGSQSPSFYRLDSQQPNTKTTHVLMGVGSDNAI